MSFYSLIPYNVFLFPDILVINYPNLLVLNNVASADGHGRRVTSCFAPRLVSIAHLNPLARSFFSSLSPYYLHFQLVSSFFHESLFFSAHQSPQGDPLPQ